jgi:amidase
MSSFASLPGNARLAMGGTVLVAALLATGLAPASTYAQQAASLDVVELTVDQVQEGFQEGRFTSVELTQAFLDRIRRYDGHYNAFISLNPDALSDAEALDRERAVSGPRSPLHGVPVALKDNLDQAGVVTTAGFEGFSSAAGGIDMLPARDAEVVRRLREAGAVFLGKTNLPDFAGHGTRTRSSVAGVTLNPYATDRVPGGSSGGTATAVNASFAVLGIGTDTGGSISNPSAAQALASLKPTFGFVPLHGVVPLDASYRDVVGPIARSIRDVALTMDIIAGPTPLDLATFAAVEHLPEGGFAAGLADGSLEGKRFGLVGLGWRRDFLPLEEETAEIYRDAVALLESLGAEVVEDPFAGTGWVDLYGGAPRPGPSTGSHDLFVYMQGLAESSPFRSPGEWEEVTGRSMPGNRTAAPVRPSATEAGDAFQGWRHDLRTLFRRVLDDHELDGLFFPQAGGPIRPMVEDPERPEYQPNNHPELPSNITNALGVPVATVPYAYYRDGTPFVIAFIGDLWTDAQLLSWAHAFEQASRSRRAPTLRTAP